MSITNDRLHFGLKHNRELPILDTISPFESLENPMGEKFLL